MAGKSYTVELTERAVRSCRDNPAVRLVALLSRLEPGDRLEVVGEDGYMRHGLVLDVLRGEGLEVVEDEYDGYTYRIIAVRRG